MSTKSASTNTPATNTPDTAATIAQAWRFDDPNASEQRFTLGHTERALEIQLRLLAEHSALDSVDGYVFEELGELYLTQGRAELAGEYFARAHAELRADAQLQRSEAPRLQRMARLGGVPEAGPQAKAR